MNKKLIAVAVAGALVAPAAMADVEVYGKAHVSFGQLDNDAAVSGSSLTMEPNNSHVGFRGSEDLGGGLKAEYQAEVAMDWDGGDGPAGTGSGWGSGRDTWVGLAGDWGKFRMGRANTPYKVSTNGMDPFADTVADYNGVMGISANGVAHDIRASNALMYMTNDINGFTAAAAYAVSDGGDLGTNPEEDHNMLSLMAAYQTGPFTVTAAYQTAMEYGGTPVGANTAEDNEAMKIGGTWMFNNNMTGISAVWENVNAGTYDSDANPLDNEDNDRDSYYLSATHMVNQTKLAIGYGAADDIGDTTDSGAQLIQVGAFHNLSKATQAYVLYGDVSYDKNTLDSTGAGGLVGYGLKSGGFTPDAADKSAMGVFVGVIHNFSSK